MNRLVEGKLPNIFVSAKVAETIDEKGQYIKNKGFDDEAYKQWIINYLKTYKKGKKKDFINLLSDKLPDSLNDNQKQSRVRYLLKTLKDEKIITTDNPNKRLANWILVKK